MFVVYCSNSLQLAAILAWTLSKYLEQSETDPLIGRVRFHLITQSAWVGPSTRESCREGDPRYN